MKKHFALVITACLLLAACQQVDTNAGFGISGAGSARFVKMDGHARHVLKDYLQASYKTNCAGKKHRPKSCVQDRPFMTNASMPVSADYQSLPNNIQNKLGFIQPGTDYVQYGYNVYLIRHDDKIIYDSVSLHPYWKESLKKD